MEENIITEAGIDPGSAGILSEPGSNGTIILELLSGQTEEATLGAPFEPDRNEIHVVLTKNKEKQKFSLSEVSCILMDTVPDDLSPPRENAVMEEVETAPGNSYQVQIDEGHYFNTGFYGFPIREDGSHRSIFFTFLGVRTRRQYRPVGQILEERGLVSQEAIEQALAEQEVEKKKRVGEIIADHCDLPQEKIEETITKAKRAGSIPSRVRVGDILVASGLVTEDQVEDALASQASGKKKKIGDLLVDRGLVSEDQILAALATKFRMRFMDLEKRPPSETALATISVKMAEQLKIIPVEDSGDCLVVATSEPTDTEICDNLRFHTQRRVEMVVATATQIDAAIKKYYHRGGLDEVDELDDSSGTIEEEAVEDLIGEMREDEINFEEEQEDQSIKESDSQTIKLVNKILIDAYKKNVSDIHCEPGLDKSPFLVRYRIDGICKVAHKVPRTFKRAVIARIKIMAQLDISERRKPQSGKILIKYHKQKIEYRVETTPTVGGNEDAVLRILASSKPLPIDKMGFSASNVENFREILSKPYGIILCVGPTGSGKTTTLHSALGYINTPERKIWTAEDPVEITQPGLRQVQVLPKIGFSFPEALRSFLRADPDVIMIGEMRDAETAKIAIEASLTGHLVLSTLHTNSAPETVVRLIEMGMDPVSFADALLGVLAQRLARRLCKCKQSYHPDQTEFEDLVDHYGKALYEKNSMPSYTDDLTLMRAAGCDECGNIGYKGRLGIHELLIGTREIKKGIKQKLTAEVLADLAIEEGMRTLKMDALDKVFQGITDLDQVMRVCL